MTDWHLTFFSGVANDFWAAAVPEDVTMAEVAYLERALRLAPGDLVVDVACGPGRHAVELAGRGIQVRGVDISADNVERLRRAAAVRGVEVEAIVGDVRDLAPTADADGAFWFGNGFGYLPPTELARALGAVAGSLRRGGRFALDTSMSAESLLPGIDLERPSEHEAGGIVLRATRRYDAKDSRVDTTYEFTRGDEVTARDASYWVVTTREIRDLVEGAGLRETSMTADLDGGAFRLGCPRLLVVAEKR